MIFNFQLNDIWFIRIISLLEKKDINIFFKLYLLDPFVNVFKGVDIFGFFKMTVGKLRIAQIPSALSNWQLTEIVRRTNLFASHCNFVAPSA